MNLNIKLFQSINSLVGRNKWLDAFGLAGAEWAIVVSVFWYGAAALVKVYPDWQIGLRPIVFLAGASSLGWLINIGIGRLVQEPRPHVTYPQSKLLFTPLSNWKSFPSDHAMAAWLIVFLGVIFNLPGVEVLLVLALWIGWGRVYAGVHYPFDIVGGAAVAGLCAMISFLILLKIL